MAVGPQYPWAQSSAWIECWTSNPMVKGSKPFGPAPAFRESSLTRTLASKLVPANTQVQGYMEFNPAGWDRAAFDSNSARSGLGRQVWPHGSSLRVPEERVWSDVYHYLCRICGLTYPSCNYVTVIIQIYKPRAVLQTLVPTPVQHRTIFVHV